MQRILAATNLQQQNYFIQKANSRNQPQQVSHLQTVVQDAFTATTTGAAAAVQNVVETCAGGRVLHVKIYHSFQARFTMIQVNS